MDALVQHVSENWVAYAVILACGMPVILIFRKYTIPVIFWTFEWIIYCGLFHVVVNVLVRIIRWFQYNTQMEMREEERVYKDWATPLIEFWDRKAYSPEWIFWVELVFVVVLLVAMIRYRPMTTQKVKPRKTALTKGMGPSKSLADKYGKKR
jgi:hypothetical protein